jgi:hypothetical protein
MRISYEVGSCPDHPEQGITALFSQSDLSGSREVEVQTGGQIGNLFERTATFIRQTCELGHDIPGGLIVVERE